MINAVRSGACSDNNYWKNAVRSGTCSVAIIIEASPSSSYLSFPRRRLCSWSIHSRVSVIWAVRSGTCQLPKFFFDEFLPYTTKFLVFSPIPLASSSSPFPFFKFRSSLLLSNPNFSRCVSTFFLPLVLTLLGVVHVIARRHIGQPTQPDSDTLLIDVGNPIQPNTKVLNLNLTIVKLD